MKFSQLVEGFFLYKDLQLSSNTKETYTYYVKSMLDYFGDRELSEISASDIQGYLSWLVNEKGLTRRSARDRHTLLSSIYNWAARSLDSDIPNPMERVQKPTVEKRVIEPLTPDELRTLIKNLDKKRLRFNAVLLVLLDSGLRVSELCNLKLGDYDQKIGKLFVREGKGAKDRIVYLGKRAQKAVWRYLLDRDKSNKKEPLFIAGTGRPLDRNNLRNDLIRYGRRFNIHLNPHKCRHTFAVNFLRNGGNVRTLQTILGHSKMDMIMTYTKLAEIDLEKAINFSPMDNL